MYDQDDKPKKSKFGCFLKILILLLLLGAGGYFGYWYYLKWQDDRAWEGALEKRTIAVFEQYISEKPDGRYLEAARTVIQRTKKKQAEAAAGKDKDPKKAGKQSEKKSLLVQEKARDNLAWKKAISQNSIAGYEDYLRNFPNGAYVKQAEAVALNLKRLQAAKNANPEEKAWKEAGADGSIDTLEAFLLDFPNGQRAADAKKLLNVLKQAKNAPLKFNEEGVSAYDQGKFSEAIEAFSKAGAKGYAPGLFNLGLVFENGSGVEVDPSKAAEWYEKAAKLGDPDAQVNYGHMLEHGDGVEENASKAASWYEKAAAQEHGIGQYNLGVLYARGQGVSKDLKRALKLFQDATDNGVQAAPGGVELVQELIAKTKPSGAAKP